MNTDLKKRKRGEVRQDGMIFFQYVGKNNRLGQRYEWWVTPQQFQKHKDLTKAAGKKSRTLSRNKAAHTGIQHSQNRFTRGDTKPDGSGYLFWLYDGYDKEGKRREKWLSPTEFDIAFKKSKEQLYRYWQNNRDKHNERLKKSADKHRSKRQEQSKQRWIDKGHIYNAKARARRKTPEGRKAKRDAGRRYMLKHPHAKIVQSLRGRLGRILRYGKNFNAGEIEKFLGCSKEKLIFHLQGQFQDGMTWNNYGDHRKGEGWVVDHIVPISHFKDIWSSKDQAVIEEHARLVNHFTNLRPLWWRDNLVKGDLKPKWVLVLGKKMWSDLHEKAFGIDPQEDEL